MENSTGISFKKYASKRLIVGALLIIALLWILGGIFGLIERPQPIHQKSSTSGQSAPLAEEHQSTPAESAAAEEHGGPTAKKPAEHLQETRTPATEEASHAPDTEEASPAPATEETSHTPATEETSPAPATEETSHAPAAEEEPHAEPVAEDDHGTAETQTAAEESPGSPPPAATHAEKTEKVAHKVKGVAFVEASIVSLDYELRHRFWGWRPNDIINPTDNVNNFQLGVLEVTRRTSVSLADRISRTGSTDAYDEHLERAMNWFMVKADRYWFPSPESKYKDSLNELEAYKAKLESGEATFFTRADNLIPLLASFEGLLGSCDENLVKKFEEDGSPVSHFKADDYFFYAKGVASAMIPILEAVHHDFLITLESRHGIEILHHAVESLKQAKALDPWLITDADLDGVLANHRANIAAPISHARFYLEVLIKTLST